MSKRLNANFYFISVVLVAITLFSGCAKYTPHPLNKPISIGCEKEKVRVAAQALTNDESYFYFSRHAVAKGYQPIHLCIENSSNQTYIFDAKSINLQIQDQHDVAQALHVNTVKRTVLWGLPGLFIWPLLIVAGVESVKSSDANTSLNNDFNNRVISGNSRLIIAPGSSINKVFFVRTENFRYHFNLKLKNRESKHELSFDIKI